MSISGVLVLDKPSGLSSNQALQRVRKHYGNAKAGYAGTLDPLATGLLPICFGEATKFIRYFSDSIKAYSATIQLGGSSTTGDLEGEVTPFPIKQFTDESLEAAAEFFTGNGRQIPPMYSAIKVRGKALYKFAREGRTVERSHRPITIHSLEIMSLEPTTLKVKTECSKGTYIRVLAEDIAHHLGNKGFLTNLRRSKVGHVSQEHSVTLNDISKRNIENRHKLLKNIDYIFHNYKSITLNQEQETSFLNGIPINVSPSNLSANDALIVVYSHDQIFLGLGDFRDGNNLFSHRCMSIDHVLSARARIVT